MGLLCRKVGEEEDDLNEMGEEGHDAAWRGHFTR